MRVLLSTYGSHGDVEPMVGLAVRLQALGAEMPVCAPPDKDLIGSRAGRLHSRTIEVLDQRGMADRFLSQGQVAQVAGFSWIPLDISDFPTGTTTGSGCGRTTSSAYWPAGWASWGCRSIAEVR
jgi:hypothetical protein